MRLLSKAAPLKYVGDERYVIRIRRRKAGKSDLSDVTTTTQEETDCNSEQTSTSTLTQEETDFNSVDAGGEQDLSSSSEVESSVKAEVKYGKAAVRSLADFEDFDTQLRREILGSATASVGEDGTYLPPLPRQKRGEKPQSLVLPLQEFLEAILLMPTAVRSAALASFLTTEPDLLPEDVVEEESLESAREHMYLEYLLPCTVQKEGYHDASAFQPIPRMGPLIHKVDVVPPGWWIVWLFRIDGKPEGKVDFTVSIDQPSKEDTSDPDETSNEAEDEKNTNHEPDSFHREEVYRQTCTIGSDQPFTGIYRFSPEVSQSTRATLQFSNVRSLSLRRGTTSVHLECTAVPHQAFRAACEAAREQNGRDARRHRAPLLYAILDSYLDKEADDPVDLFVEPYSDEKKAVNPVEAAGATPISEDDFPMVLAEKDEELGDLRAEISELEKERDYIRGELGRVTRQADDGKRKLQMLVSEKQVSSVAKEEIQTELSRLTAELEAEREMKNEALLELETSQQDVQRLQGEVKLLECRVPCEEDEDQQRELMEQTETDVNEMEDIGELDEEVGALKAKIAALEETLADETKACEERIAEAREEVDDVVFELEASKQEIERLQREVDFLECRVPGEEDEDRHRQLLEQNQTDMNEIKELVKELEEEIGTLKARNASLEETLDDEKKAHEERIAEARTEVDEVIFELETSKQEVERLNREVDLLECRVPCEEDEARQRQLLEQNQAEMDGMKAFARELKEEVRDLKTRNAALEEKLDEQKRTCEERVAEARAEVDEAKSSQRILEGKVRDFEKAQLHSVEGRSSRKGVNRTAEAVGSASCGFRDPKNASFQHPDEWVNEQLSSLRDRHAQLSKVLQQDPSNTRITELIGKIEKAISDIVSDDSS